MAEFNLNVGDKVIVLVSHYSDKTYYLGTVVKKTPTGLLDIKYSNTITRFRPNGSIFAKHTPYSTIRHSLIEYSEEMETRIKEQNMRRFNLEFVNRFSYDSLNNSQLDSIVKLLKSFNND